MTHIDEINIRIQMLHLAQSILRDNRSTDRIVANHVENETVSTYSTEDVISEAEKLWAFARKTT